MKSLISIPATQEVLQVLISEWQQPREPPKALQCHIVRCHPARGSSYDSKTPSSSSDPSPAPEPDIPCISQGGHGGVAAHRGDPHGHRQDWAHLRPGTWAGVVPCLLLHMGRMQLPNSSWKGGWRRMGRSSRNLTASSHPSVTFAIAPPPLASPESSHPHCKWEAVSEEQHRLGKKKKGEKKKAKTHNCKNKHCKRQSTSNIKGIKLLLSARRTQKLFPDVAGLSPSLINSASNSLSEGCWRFRGS